jgi:hypothetical protein
MRRMYDLPLAVQIEGKFRHNDETGCDEWLGAKDPRGYPIAHPYVHGKRKTVGLHRLIYRELKGSIPAGMFVCHSCDNPSCINIDHLFLGTHSDNMADMYAKGRGPTGDRAGFRKHPEKVRRGLPKRKLTADIVRLIREEYQPGSRESGAMALARKYNSSPNCVRLIARRETYKDIA